MVQYELVAESKSCVGSYDDYQGSYTTVAECAKQCLNKATMFTFGFRDIENKETYGCEIKKCHCCCQTQAYADGTCEMSRQRVSHNLYRIIRQGKRSFVLDISIKRVVISKGQCPETC